jgi:hypothetical protein
VCVWERESVCVGERECVCERERLCVWVRERVCVWLRECVCVCKRDREKSNEDKLLCTGYFPFHTRGGVGLCWAVNESGRGYFETQAECYDAMEQFI